MLSTKISFETSVVSVLFGLEVSFVTLIAQSSTPSFSFSFSILNPKVCAYLLPTFPTNPVLNLFLVIVAPLLFVKTKSILKNTFVSFMSPLLSPFFVIALIPFVEIVTFK